MMRSGKARNGIVKREGANFDCGRARRQTLYKKLRRANGIAFLNVSKKAIFASPVKITVKKFLLFGNVNFVVLIYFAEHKKSAENHSGEGEKNSQNQRTRIVHFIVLKIEQKVSRNRSRNQA